MRFILVLVMVDIPIRIFYDKTYSNEGIRGYNYLYDNSFDCVNNIYPYDNVCFDIWFYVHIYCVGIYVGILKILDVFFVVDNIV